MTYTSRLLVFSWEVTKSSRHPTKSDFERLLNFRFCANAGRYAWFLCEIYSYCTAVVDESEEWSSENLLRWSFFTFLIFMFEKFIQIPIT